MMDKNNIHKFEHKMFVYQDLLLLIANERCLSFLHIKKSFELNDATCAWKKVHS